ncbi:hypothetical protein GEMRC1_013797 [Eukaryota sp. GEM-RC1]
MLHRNTTLLVLILVEISLNSDQLRLILQGLEMNSTIKTVSLPPLDITCLFLIFERILTSCIIPNVQVSPHHFDFSCGLFTYENMIEHDGLTLLLNSLKSNIPIRRVDCHGFKYPNLEGLITLFEILSITNSVINLDISPHIIDVDNGLFGFSPEHSTVITTEEVASLKCLIECFGIKAVTLTGCHFTDDTITALSGLISLSTSLTSVDFSHCQLNLNLDYYCTSNHLFDDVFLKLINILQSNDHLKKVNLSNQALGFKTLLRIFELISTDKLTPNVSVLPNSIDFSLGSIRYESTITDDDLIMLLKSLKSTVAIKRVECHGLTSPNLE